MKINSRKLSPAKFLFWWVLTVWLSLFVTTTTEAGIITSTSVAGGSDPVQLYVVTSNSAAPLVIYPPGYDLSGFTIVAATQSQIDQALDESSPNDASSVQSASSLALAPAAAAPPPALQVQPNLVGDCVALAFVGLCIIGAVYLCYRATHPPPPPPLPPPQPPQPPPLIIVPPIIINPLVTHNGQAQPGTLLSAPLAALVVGICTNVTVWDISAQGWADWAGNPYDTAFSYQMNTNGNGPNLQISSNLLNWAEATYCVTGYVSYFQGIPTNVCVIIYDGGGNVQLTDWTPAAFFDGNVTPPSVLATNWPALVNSPKGIPTLNTPLFGTTPAGFFRVKAP